MAQVRRLTCTWLPKLEVDGLPIAYDASLRHYRGGHAGLVVEALEQPLLLPKDMEAYRNFNHPELFLSLKRDLAMVSCLNHRFTLILPCFLSFHNVGKTPPLFFCLGHTAGLRGLGVGEERLWRGQGCLGRSI